MAKNQKDIFLIQFLIAQYIHLVVTNIWLPVLPNDLGRNIFAVTLWTTLNT